jgi:hypothetical protein
MKTIKHFLAVLLCLALSAPLTLARPAWGSQQETIKTDAQDVLIIIQQEQVRFTAQKAVAEMQLQVFDQAGQVVYDSGVVAGPELNWVLRQAGGEAVKSGLYAYALSLKEAGAETARTRRGHFIVDRARERDGQTDRLWITSQNEGGVGTELTVVRNEGEVVAGTIIASERQNLQAGDKEQAEREGESKSGIERKATETASTLTAVTGKTTIRGTQDPLLEIDHTGTAGNPAIWFKQDGAPKAFMWWDRANNRFNLGTPTANPILTLLNNGNVGIGTTTPNSKLEIAAQDGLTISGYQPFLTLRDTNSFGNRSILQGANGDFNFYPNTFIGGYPAVVIKNHTGSVGIGTPNPHPEARLDVAGQTRTVSLQITGGADFAENFEVNAGKADDDAMTAKVEAGMVVSIDQASPGKLQLSARAYDRRVAGIISGAGGVKPGMVMSQEGTVADGKFPVALTGRVYCWVDASQGAIEPGDLLTTSHTPGHAMKAADAAQAQGAIIGKAMTGLKEGKGLVLVLVNLQ